MTIKFNHVIPEPLASNYNPDSAIWNREFSLEVGKQYIINAKSGKGKSTFAQIIYGTRKDYTGEVFIDNKSIKSFSNDELATLRQTGISILFQDLRLFNDLSAKDNVLVNAVLDENPSLHLIDTWANKLGVAHLLDRKVSVLSYGERQRIAIIRALIQPFDWLLLDEPFSHLDLENTQIAYALIQERAKELNAGIVFTTLGEDHFLKGEMKEL